jgi:hypothetical protein
VNNRARSPSGAFAMTSSTVASSQGVKISFAVRFHGRSEGV